MQAASRRAARGTQLTPFTPGVAEAAPTRGGRSRARACSICAPVSAPGRSCLLARMSSEAPASFSSRSSPCSSARQSCRGAASKGDLRKNFFPCERRPRCAVRPGRLPARRTRGRRRAGAGPRARPGPRVPPREAALVGAAALLDAAPPTPQTTLVTLCLSGARQRAQHARAARRGAQRGAGGPAARAPVRGPRTCKRAASALSTTHSSASVCSK